MTLRAFVSGLLAVIAVGLLDPYTSFNKGYGWNTQGHFPVAAVFILVVFAVGINALLRLVGRRLAFRQSELLLIWCMLIVGCATPSNLMRFWFPQLAAPAYLARRPDIPWKETSLAVVPSTLLLTKDLRSVAAEQFFESFHGEGRVPWGQWLVPISRWAILMAFFYLATFFLCGIVRRQWMDRERLQFPLARIPMEFTDQGGGQGLLPALFANRAFLLGLTIAGVVKLARMMPLALGSARPWNVTMPFSDIIQATPLQQMYLENFSLLWFPIGLGYLVPADVSLSIWFFYLFGRMELQTAAWFGSPLHYGGTYGEMMQWHRPGAYLAFTVGALFIARRHLADVARKAFGAARSVDDRREPVGFALGFWGLLLCSAGAVGWFMWYGLQAWVAVLYFLLLMCMQLVNSRVVAQSGVYRTAPLGLGPGLLQALGFGHVFGPKGAVVASMQYTIMIGGDNSMLGPAAIHAFRISEVFEKGRRLLLPALAVALAASIAASSWMCLHQAYTDGALNYTHTWASIVNPKSSFDMAHQIIRRPTEVVRIRWVPFGLGMALTAFTMLMRARFYWWPIHPIGLLAYADYGLDRMWFSFFLGWLVKMSLVKFGSGRLLRQGRYFFIGFIISEVFLDGAWSVICLLTGGAVRGAGVWV